MRSWDDPDRRRWLRHDVAEVEVGKGRLSFDNWGPIVGLETGARPDATVRTDRGETGVSGSETKDVAPFNSSFLHPRNGCTPSTGVCSRKRGGALEGCHGAGTLLNGSSHEERSCEEWNQK